MRLLPIPLLAAVCAALCATPAPATPIEVAFTATVTEVDPASFPPESGNFGSVAVGSEINGSYRFESSRSGESHPGYYDELSPPFGLDFAIGEDHYESFLPPPGGPIDSFRLRTVVYDDTGWWVAAEPLPTDQLSILASIRDLSGQRTFAVLYFVDPTGTAFSGLELPAYAPDLSIFTMAELHIWHLSGEPAVIARITSTALVVPEPSTALLLGCGLALLAVRRAKR